MPSLSFNELIIAILTGLVLLLVLWLVVLTVILRRLHRTRLKVVKALRGEIDLEQALGKSFEDIAILKETQGGLAAAAEGDRSLLSETIRHVGLVRYDAFEQAGGEMSFSAALLNEGGDGIVLSSINGRSDSRVYAKPVVDRRSEFNLSEEEERAIAEAFMGAKV